MAWRLARSLITLTTEINTAWPGRSKASDGTIGDAAHRARKSDHNPNALGVVRAADFTAEGVDASGLAEHIRTLGASGYRPLGAGGYVIYNRRIASWANGWRWERYTGANPHTAHVHVSVSRDGGRYDLTDSWAVDATQTPAPTPVPTPTPAFQPEQLEEEPMDKYIAYGPANAEGNRPGYVTYVFPTGRILMFGIRDGSTVKGYLADGFKERPHDAATWAAMLTVAEIH